MDNIPITRLEELEVHLDELIQNPEAPINTALFDHVELQLTEANIPPLIPRVLPKVAGILKTYNGDPAVLCSLALKLLQPTTFAQVLTITSEDELVQALRSPAPSANVLGMAIIHKAADSPADAAILSVSTPLVTEFVTRWLSAPEVEVGERGARALIDLLDTDCELPPPPPPSRDALAQQQLVRRRSPGHGKLWRRLFHDREVFGLLVDLCEGRRVGGGGSVNGHSDEDGAQQRSLSQGRLLRVLPHLAVIDFSGLTRSNLQDLLPRHTGTAGPDSLLHYAALRMIDRDDPLLRLLLIDFLERLVCCTALSEHSAYKTETLRALLRDVTALDDSLTRPLSTLPDRVVPEEQATLRRWVNELMPPSATRVG